MHTNDHHERRLNSFYPISRIAGAFPRTCRGFTCERAGSWIELSFWYQYSLSTKKTSTFTITERWSVSPHFQRSSWFFCRYCRSARTWDRHRWFRYRTGNAEAPVSSVFMIYEKYRTTYQLNQCEVALDELPFGNFLWNWRLPFNKFKQPLKQ